MDVNILISTKDRAQFLSRTLDSLSRVRTDSFEVELIVIDNGSSDETAAVTAEAARRFPFRLADSDREVSGLYGR
jgi:glycosyltransferase involved in cell wall biosynthesis